MFCKLLNKKEKKKFFIKKDDSDSKEISVRLYNEIFNKYKDYLDDDQIKKLSEINKNKKSVLKSLYRFRNNKPVEEWLTPFLIKTYELNTNCIKKKLDEIDEAIDKKAQELLKEKQNL